MQVLFDATPLARGHATRGIGTATRELVAALARVRPPDQRPELLVTTTQDIPDGFSSHRFSWPRWRVPRIPDPWPALHLNVALDRLRPRLFHAMQPQLMPDPATHPTSVTCYDLIPLHLPMRNPLDRHVYATFLQRLTRARMILAISQATADDLTEQLGIPPERIRVVYLGLPPAAVPSGPTPDAPYVLYTNGIEAHKNPETVIRAIARIRDVNLVMTGTWSRRRLSRLRALADAISVGSRMHWAGYTSAEQLAALRRDARAVVVPSRMEGFGFPVVEALAAGTPVIASDIPALREAGGSVASYVDADDVDAWSAAISAAAESTDDSARETGPAHAATFSWDHTAEATIDAWREVLHSA
jgi:glycosyltransferase involved in cell wall biosynthesis